VRSPKPNEGQRYDRTESDADAQSQAESPEQVITVIPPIREWPQKRMGTVDMGDDSPVQKSVPRPDGDRLADVPDAMMIHVLGRQKIQPLFPFSISYVREEAGYGQKR